MLVERQQIYRYLGYGDTQPGAQVRHMVEECLSELETQCDKRSISRRCKMDRPCPGMVSLGGIKLKSRKLYELLAGCREAVVLALTLGPGADLLLQKWERLDISRAVILQACAAAMTESYCRDCLEEMETSSTKPDSLFCPGYGDFSLEAQEILLGLLEAPKRIGLTMTKSRMLVPTKSLVGIAGLRPVEEGRKPCRNKCSICGMTGCPYRNVVDNGFSERLGTR